MPKTSAGILLYRRQGNELEVLLVHPGGPFWTKKDLGAWSLAKGEYQEGEDPLCAALREFFEETGHRPTGPFLPLGERKQPSGKRILAWPPKVIGIPPVWFQTRSTWSGPGAQGESGSFPR